MPVRQLRSTACQRGLQVRLRLAAAHGRFDYTALVPCFAGNQPDLQDCCLVLGTSLGYMQLHAEDGLLLHRQRIHTSQAQSVQARTAGKGKLQLQADTRRSLCISSCQVSQTQQRCVRLAKCLCGQHLLVMQV